MEQNEATSATSTNEGSEEPSPAKQAACLECRRSKVKCFRLSDAIACKKCQNAGIECVVPEYHVGRYKGVKNKRSGLEKAIFQVEEAVKKARTSGSGLQNEHTEALQRLLDDSKDAITHVHSDTPNTKSRLDPTQHTAIVDGANNIPTLRGPNLTRSTSFSHARNDSFSQPEKSGEVTINNADNPLQLLAIASAIPDANASGESPATTGKVSPGNRTTSTEGRTGPLEEDETVEFFSPIASHLDLGPQLDPVDQGLLTLDEAKILFKYFHDNLAHTRWGLDRALHTADYVRARSAYLFASIAAASALFLPDMYALSIRLTNHCKTLLQQILVKGFRSLEVVLALMINVPWMQPGRSWAADDQTCFYLSTAMTIAIDLSLNKIVIPSSTMRPQGIMERTAQADCIDAQRALNIDGHVDVDSDSVLGRRLLRSRERAWIALFTLDRGVCLARGRPWTVPTGPLIDTCDAWHVSEIGDQWDGSLIASCVLRRDFGGLVSSIRTTCDNNQFSLGDGTTVVKYMREKVEGFFAQWYSTWSFQIRQSDGTIPPYVEILVSHGKLSAYCNVINHPTASTEMKQFFRAAGLTAALNVIRVAVQNERRLQSMPNNSVIMVSFAACFVLGLSTTKRGDQIYLAENAKKSIREAANVLERIGKVTPQRKGASAMFGKHIKRIMQQHTASFDHTASGQMEQHGGDGMDTGYSGRAIGIAQYALQPMSDEASQVFPGFSSMTDDQLLAAIQNSKDDIESFNAGLQSEDGIFMDWLDWPNLT